MTIEGMDRVLAKIGKLKSSVPLLVPAVTLALVQLEGAARDNASGPRPTHIDKVTGNLVNNIKMSGPKVSGTEISGEVQSTVEYARIHEYGGIIRPKNKKMLKWVGSDGQAHFAYAATIPARPYMRPALAENREAIGQNVKEAFIRLFS